MTVLKKKGYGTILFGSSLCTLTVGNPRSGSPELLAGCMSGMACRTNIGAFNACLSWGEIEEVAAKPQPFQIDERPA